MEGNTESVPELRVNHPLEIATLQSPVYPETTLRVDRAPDSEFEGVKADPYKFMERIGALARLCAAKAKTTEEKEWLTEIEHRAKGMWLRFMEDFGKFQEVHMKLKNELEALKDKG